MRRARKKKRISDPDWKKLFDRAQEVVRQTIGLFPPELKVKAKALPCVLRKWPEESDDALGHFIGFEEDHCADSNGPILLYVGTIHEYCQENDLVFEEEIRMTFLHEFGHYLGWDEDELERRGLL